MRLFPRNNLESTIQIPYQHVRESSLLDPIAYTTDGVNLGAAAGDYRDALRQAHKKQSGQLDNALAVFRAAAYEQRYATDRLAVALVVAEAMENELREFGEDKESREDEGGEKFLRAELTRQKESALKRRLADTGNAQSQAVALLHNTCLRLQETGVRYTQGNELTAAAAAMLPKLLKSCMGELAGSDVTNTWTDNETALLERWAPSVDPSLKDRCIAPPQNLQTQSSVSGLAEAHSAAIALNEDLVRKLMDENAALHRRIQVEALAHQHSEAQMQRSMTEEKACVEKVTECQKMQGGLSTETAELRVEVRRLRSEWRDVHTQLSSELSRFLAVRKELAEERLVEQSQMQEEQAESVLCDADPRHNPTLVEEQWVEKLKADLAGAYTTLAMRSSRLQEVAMLRNQCESIENDNLALQVAAEGETTTSAAGSRSSGGYSSTLSSVHGNARYSQEASRVFECQPGDVVGRVQ